MHTASSPPCVADSPITFVRVDVGAAFGSCQPAAIFFSAASASAGWGALAPASDGRAASSATFGRGVVPGAAGAGTTRFWGGRAIAGGFATWAAYLLRSLYVFSRK